MDERGATSEAETTQERVVSGEPPSEAVVRAVANAHGRNPTDLPPLSDVLDPEAVDELFADTVSGRSRSGGYLEFEYCDCTVAVLGSQKVVVDTDPR